MQLNIINTNTHRCKYIMHEAHQRQIRIQIQTPVYN